MRKQLLRNSSVLVDDDKSRVRCDRKLEEPDGSQNTSQVELILPMKAEESQKPQKLPTLLPVGLSRRLNTCWKHQTGKCELSCSTRRLFSPPGS